MLICSRKKFRTNAKTIFFFMFVIIILTSRYRYPLSCICSLEK